MILALHKKNSSLFWPVTVVSVALISWLIGTHGLIGAVVMAVLLIGLVALVYPEVLFVGSIGSIVIGQIIRLPVLGADNSIILNDILIPVLFTVWILKKMASRCWDVPRHSLSLPLWSWFSVMVVSLLVNTAGYSQRELVSGALYLLRWLEYAVILWIAFDYCRTRARAEQYFNILVWTGTITAILGFIQLVVFPDFTFMVPQGWDPHVGRLLSTWFDPNFLGGYLSLLVTVALAVALSRPARTVRWLWVAIGVMILAIILTYSRSAYVALAVGAGFVTAIRSRLIFFLGLATFLAVVLFVPRVQERVIGIRNIDETAKLRLVSWSNALDVIHDHPALGIGYNLYRYVQVQYGFIDNPQEHSGSGSDSSFLTAWVTTGTIGLIIYLWLFAAMMREAWKTWRAKSLPPEWRGFGLGLVAGLLAVFAHSQFVNSLFYPHLMEVLWIFMGIAIMVRQSQPG